MDHRLGTCSACSARYQIPATFPHSRAKCRSCGGVVEIGPVVGAKPARSSGAAPAARETSQASEAGEPAARAERPVERPSIAREPSAERTPDSTGRATPQRHDAPVTPAPKSAPARPESPAKADSPTTPETPAKPSLERAARDPKAAPARPARDPKPAGTPEPKRKSKVVPVVLVALMLTAAAIAAFFYSRGERDDAAHAAPPRDESQPEAAAPEATAKTDAPAGSQAPRALDRDLADAASVDLAALADLATSDLRASADGAKLDAALQRFLAAPTDAERELAARELVAAGRPALLLALDAWKRIDLATDDGRADATALEREIVSALAGGRSFGWKPDASEASRLFDAKVIEQWHRVAASDDAWQRFLAPASTR